MTTTDRTPRRFPVDAGPLALAEDAVDRGFAPSSFLFLFDDRPPAPPYRLVGDVAVVDVHGPLMARADGWWDGYDAVIERVSAALADDKARALVLSLDSPGGIAAGNLDASRELAARVGTSRKPCVAHAGTLAASAAYALACAADYVMLTTDGAVGSVGTLAVVYDRTKANESEGLNVQLVRSGALKADPHPDAPLTDAAVSRVRARINELAGMFAAWVGERRRMTADAVLGLQGAVVYGAKAIDAGLADSTGTLADAINTAASLAASMRKKMDHETKLAAVLTALGATSHEEALATIATQKKSADALAATRAELETAREQIAQRDAADAARAREGVLARHRDRGALTPAMEADSAFVADLAPLSAEALDRVLAKLPGAPKAVQPKTPAATDPRTADDSLTDTDRQWAQRFGVTPEAMERAAKRDRERASARGLADTE